jgi:hypothetical protein
MIFLPACLLSTSSFGIVDWQDRVMIVVLPEIPENVRVLSSCCCPGNTIQRSTLAIAGKILSTPSGSQQYQKENRNNLYTSTLQGIWANLLSSVCEKLMKISGL